MQHLFVSFKNITYQDAVAYLRKKQVSNIRLVGVDINTNETTIEADIPNGVIKTLCKSNNTVKTGLKM